MSIAAAPLVLLCNENTPWADYLGEMLCTEGLPWFERAESWADVGALADTQSVLLIPHGDTNLPTVRAWVEAGGGVVAMRPDAELAALAGLEPLGRRASELPLLLEPPFDCGQARAHGEVDLCKLRDGEALAHVLCDGEQFPAAAVCGRVAAFAFDLPRSAALTRQGNPEWTGERGTDLGSNTFRPADLFVRGCGARTWLDFPSSGAPAADMQQRLLAYLIDRVSPRPLPRVWYLPDNKPTVLCVLGDSDGADPDVIEEQLDDVAAAGGCMSSYMIDHSVDSSSAEDAARWRAAGHDISVHPDYARHGDKSVPNADTMRLAQGTLIDRFRAKFGFSPRTLRNHSICWVGFAEQAEIERGLGIRLNAAYAYSSGFADARYRGGAVGYLNGSGQPQKFADENGRVLDIYQLGAQVCDEAVKSQYLSYDADQAWAATKQLIDASMARWHSFLGLSFHPISYHGNPEVKRWLRGLIIPYALERGLPLWSAAMILDFADARRSCKIVNMDWRDGKLSFQLHAPAGVAGLTLMLPADAHGAKLTSVSMGGEAALGTDRDFAGRGWRCVVIDSGQTEVEARYES